MKAIASVNYVWMMCAVFAVTSIAYGRTEEQLFWLDKQLISQGVTLIQSLSGDPMQWLTGTRLPSNSTLPPTEGRVSDGVKLAVSPTSGERYWSENGRKEIVVTAGERTLPIYSGTSDSVSGLTVDWLSGNIYWTDTKYNWLLMASLTTHRNYRIVADTDLDKPSDVAVDPNSRYIFWCDSGVQPKMERSTLAGEQRSTIVTSDIWRPSAITLDLELKHVYWTEAHKGTLNRVNYGGTQRWSVEMNLQNGNLLTSATGVALFKEYVFVSEGEGIHVFNKISMQHVGDIRAQPRGMSAVNTVNKASSPCDSAGCQHICVNTNSMMAECLCSLGYELQMDKKSCKLSTFHYQPRIIYSNGTSICALGHNVVERPLDTRWHCFITLQMPVQSMAYSAHADMLFFTQRNHVYRLRLETGETPQVLLSELGNIQGLAVDWIQSHLYWTNDNPGQIRVSDVSGRFQRTLVEGVDMPWSIAVNPTTKSLFWSSHGQSPKLEMSLLDGSRRSVLVNNLHKPSSLTVDVTTNTIYWTDEVTGLLECLHLQTMQRTLLVNAGNKGLQGAAVFKDFLLWTTGDAMHFSSKTSAKEQRPPIASQTFITHVISFDGSAQPISTSACNDGDSGGCDHLCFPTSSGRTCECQFGFTKNYTSCVSRPLTDEFILATDYLKTQLYQVNLNNATDVRAIPVSPLDNAVALEYDDKNHMLYWTDVQAKVIKRASLDGTNEQVIQTLLKGSIPAGLAADFTKDVLFYTDMGRHSINSLTLTGARHRTILTNVSSPRAITICTKTRLIYFASQGARPRIFSMTYTGSHMEVLVDTSFSIRQPNGLALDYEGHRLYWCDGFYGKIESVVLDGTNRRTVFYKKDAMLFDIYLHGSWIYFSDWSKGAIFKVNTKDRNSLKVVSEKQFTRPNDIIVYSHLKKDIKVKPVAPSTPISQATIICIAVLSVTAISSILLIILVLKWCRVLEKCCGIKRKKKLYKKKKIHHTSQRPAVYDNPLVRSSLGLSSTNKTQDNTVMSVSSQVSHTSV